MEVKNDVREVKAVVGPPNFHHQAPAVTVAVAMEVAVAVREEIAGAVAVMVKMAVVVMVTVGIRFVL